MRILMLGNSFTFANDMPSMLAGLMDAEVIQNTTGDVGLSDHLDPESLIGACTLAALEHGTWDYVVLQEMSYTPVTDKEAFLKSAAIMCEKVHAAGAVPLFYATWAYQKGSEIMAAMPVSYDVMAAQLSAAYHEAAEQGDALVADVGQKFYKLSSKRDLYAEDGCHPNEEGSRLAAETIAAAIRGDLRKKQKISATETIPRLRADDQRLRVLYLYQLLLHHTDPDHPLSTNQIRSLMLKEHGISMHRTTLPVDVALLQAAGIPIHARRSRVMLYHMEETRFELAELKLLIDAVISSKFITEKKSRVLTDKLAGLTSKMNASNLKRNLHITGRAKSGNEKGYYIVDAVNEAINSKRQISFLYTDFDAEKQRILRNDGEPYTVSPYTLIWNGDYYYLVGWYHEKERITVFRVDRILMQPDILPEPAMPAPEDFDISRYTSEVFRMYDTEKTRTVTLACDNSIMKGIIDTFGMDVPVKYKNKSQFSVKVDVCTSPTFYSWVFQWEGRVKILAPKSVAAEYREMLQKALDS